MAAPLKRLCVAPVMPRQTSISHPAAEPRQSASKLLNGADNRGFALGAEGGIATAAWI